VGLSQQILIGQSESQHYHTEGTCENQKCSWGEAVATRMREWGQLPPLPPPPDGYTHASLALAATLLQKVWAFMLWYDRKRRCHQMS